MNILTKMYDEYKNESRLPIRFYIPLTLSCNLSCTYCFQKYDIKKQDLTKENLDKIFESILNVINKTKNKHHIIVLYGGEPLLSKNFKQVNEIFNFCKKNKIKIQIISNGINIPYYIELFNNFNDIIDNITVTIDGLENIHNKFRILKNDGNSYNIIKENISLLEKNGISYSIRINMTKELLSMYDTLGFEDIKKEISIL